MSDDLRKFLRSAKELGFTPAGKDGRGHIRLRNSNGSKVSISSTPSDSRSRRNELTRMQRAAGRKLRKAK